MKKKERWLEEAPFPSKLHLCSAFASPCCTSFLNPCLFFFTQISTPYQILSCTHMSKVLHKRRLQHISSRIRPSISSTATCIFPTNTIPFVVNRTLHITLARTNPLYTHTMADDASYSSFLNQTNQPVSAQSQTESTSKAHSRFDPTESHSAAPASISSLLDTNPTFTSETDSPFKVVFFNYAGADLPSASQFKQCLSKSKSHSAFGEIEELSVKDFDPKNEYKSVIDAVSQAGASGKGDLKIYRVQVSTTRVEYYIITIAADGRKLVGVFTEAVES